MLMQLWTVYHDLSPTHTHTHIYYVDAGVVIVNPPPSYYRSILDTGTFVKFLEITFQEAIYKWSGLFIIILKLFFYI